MWNNRKETNKFKKEQEKQEEYYRKNGMSESGIKAIKDFDKDIFKKDRKYYEHQKVYLEEIEDFQLDLNSKLVVTIEDEITYDSIIDSISNESLAKSLKKLDFKEFKILIMIAVECHTQAYVAAQMGVSQKTISKKYNKILKNLRKEV